MIKIEFAGSADRGRTLNSFVSKLGTGGLEQRLAQIDELDDTFAEECCVPFSMSGNLDAPEMIPTGALITARHWPTYNVRVEPETVARF